MSWHYSQALVAEYSAANCSDGARSALSKTSPMPATFSWLDKTTDVSKPSRSGMMSAPLTDELGAELLMSFQAASRVRTSAPPEKAQALKASDPVFGTSSLGSLAKYNRASSSWRTAQRSLLADSEPFSETWPRWGSQRNMEFWERTTPAHLTSVTASGSWLPTPAASSYGTNQGGAAGRTGKIRPSLDTMARKNMWPTPTLAAQVGGQLNPTWVEWLMAWPLGWTDCAASGTDKFQQWQRSHGKR